MVKTVWSFLVVIVVALVVSGWVVMVSFGVLGHELHVHNLFIEYMSAIKCSAALCLLGVTGVIANAVRS